MNWKQIKETIETDLLVNLSENSRRRAIQKQDAYTIKYATTNLICLYLQQVKQ